MTGLTLLLLTLVSSPGAEPPLIEWQGRTMGSDYTVKIAGTNLPGPTLDRLQAEVEARLKEINRQMSHYQPDSELSRFNQGPADTRFKVAPEFARVIRFSLEVNRLSDGAFDPTLGPVINLWGFGEKTDQRAVPSEAALEAARKLTGCQHLAVTDQDELIKRIPGLRVNLSAVAKGFGADAMAQVLAGHGLSNVYVSIAGEVRVLGHNARGTPWQVGISAPLEQWRENDPMVAVVSISNQALSTSGDYQKYFKDAAGRRLSHIFDPRTGRPVQHDLGGVSVVAPDGMTADALGTTLFVLGWQDGLKFIESWTNAAALFIVRETDGRFRPIASSKFQALTGYAPPAPP